MEHNPYDFMYNAPQPHAAGKNRKLFVVAIGGAVLVAFAWLIGGIFLGSDSANLSSVTLKQENIIKITDLALKSSKATETKTLAATVSSVVSTQNQSVLKLASGKASNEDKQKAAADYKNVEDQLKVAEQSNNYDQKFKEIITIELEEYQKLLNETGGSTKQKKLLEDINSEINLMLGKT